MNKVMLIGKLGKDPETKDLGTTSVTQFSLATNESYKNKEGQKVEKTEWHQCKVWGDRGKILAQYISKGSTVYIEGKLETESWEKDGEKRSRTVVVVHSYEFLDAKKDTGKREQEAFDDSDKDDDLPF